MPHLFRAVLFLASAVGAGASPLASAQTSAGPGSTPADTEHIQYFRVHSSLLSEFHGRAMYLEAGVVIPPGREAYEELPLCLSVHGFGGSHHSAWAAGPQLVEWMEAGVYPRMLYVYLNARLGTGHHVFADSVNNGPFGKALVEEMIPALEDEFDAGGHAAARFVTGHSSGGWSSLWLQVNYPDVFGGCWSTAPDPVDFRSFSGVDLYSFDCIFTDPSGQEIPAIRQGGEFVLTSRQAMSRPEYQVQLESFEAVFSPRGEDGKPRSLFDRETGQIDRVTAVAWKDYDISHRLQAQWDVLGPQLEGKVNVYVGLADTIRLEAAVQLLEERLAALGSDARFVLVEGRDHFDLIQPHPEHWPEGMITRIHREMWARFISG